MRSAVSLMVTDQCEASKEWETRSRSKQIMQEIYDWLPIWALCWEGQRHNQGHCKEQQARPTLSDLDGE